MRSKIECRESHPMFRRQLLLAAAVLAMTGCADASCFIPETVLPKREVVLAQVDHGQAGRELMMAVYDGDATAVAQKLARDPLLKSTQGGVFGDLLSVAVARCDKTMVSRLLASGVPADGPPGNEPPLTLALRVTEPWFAETLLNAGASPNRLRKSGGRPLDDAIMIGSVGAVELLIAHGARLDARDSFDATPLHTALYSDSFAIAELLIARGADPWAVDRRGGSLGGAVSQPSLSRTPGDAEAQARLAAKLPMMGWPMPPPTPTELRALVAAGKWPPARARH